MFSSLNKPYPFNDNLKSNLQAILGISLGIFLFLLFFLPFNPQTEEFNKKLLIIAGFGIIILIFLFLVRIALPSFFPKLFIPEKWKIKKELLLHFIFIVLNSVAFSFYARFVGKIDINFHLAVNIVLISLAAVIILVIINEYEFLKRRVEHLLNQLKTPDFQPSEEETETGIEFESENQSEHLFLYPEQVILIKAANNYIEIIFRQNEKVSRRLIRNTLKNTEKILLKYPSLIRVHRSYIVNVNSIQKVNKSAEGLKLSLYDYPKGVNVSRQYILNVKDALKNGN